MVTEYYSLKQNRFNLHDWLMFKKICQSLGNSVDYVVTGKSKTMFYIKVVGKESTWKQILEAGTNFDYVPGNVNNRNINWNQIKTRI